MNHTQDIPQGTPVRLTQEVTDPDFPENVWQAGTTGTVDLPCGDPQYVYAVMADGTYTVLDRDEFETITPEPVKQDTPTVRIIPSSRLFGMAGSHVVTIDTTHGYRGDRPIGIHFYSDRTRTTLCVTRRPADALFGNWERDERAIRI